ncbi:MAG: hypothetical protein PQJ49_10435 [Sphaerochaetaceae bacterium]|nr:hypothetical protein [Sphaerochaetaceae bacterium]
MSEFKKIEIDFSVNVDFKIKEGFLSEELMDAYEKHFYNISNDSDYDHLETREDKHLANIAWYLMRGETDFIEGYGEVSNFIESEKVTLMEVEK